MIMAKCRPTTWLRSQSGGQNEPEKFFRIAKFIIALSREKD
jgi:hypothetical protein